MTAASPAAQMLATGFIVDTRDGGTIFPSAGGNSADPGVQAVYWRCIVVFFASARYANPDLRLALFCNVEPPEVDGIAIAPLLERLRVEQHRAPLTARLPAGTTAMWGNVLYFLDVFDALAATEAPGLRVALADSDVVITGSVAPLFALLESHAFAGYVVDTGLDAPINGMTRRELGAVAAQIDGCDRADGVRHFGGEMLIASVAAWRTHGATFRALFADALAGTGPARNVRTEEHLYSIVFALLGAQVASANGLMKRIWTSARLNTACAGDERLPIWHMPAEKRYGLADLFADLARRGFPATMDLDAFRMLAQERCGLPRKTLGKLTRDGVRQVASKLGLRT